METKGIDLKKCNSCRFRAVVDGKEVTGRIEKAKTGFLLTGDDLFGCVISYLELATLRGGTDIIIDDGGFRISGFEIVPRDPETYKDWQVGDVIGCLDEEGDMDIVADHLCRVIFRSGELVAIAENYSAEEADINGCYTCSQIFREGWRLVLTDIERQIIEERKKYEPQDGDIVAWKDKEDNGKFAITISRGKECGYFTLFTNGTIESSYCTLSMNIIRPATDEEKQRLFDAMAKEGKRWNAEKKVVEDIPKPYEFRKGEPVLVRTDYGRDWKLAAYVELSSIPNAAFGKYGVTDGRSTLFYRFCLPYNERTMHLLGTTEDYKEE